MAGEDIAVTPLDRLVEAYHELGEDMDPATAAVHVAAVRACDPDWRTRAEIGYGRGLFDLSSDEGRALVAFSALERLARSRR